MKILYKSKSLNIFILIVLFLLGFSVFYFLYYRQRNQSDIFVTVSVSRPYLRQEAPDSWLPYWLANSLNIGDKEISPLGGTLVTVEDKQTYEGLYSGKYVYLLLKIRTIRDRSGVYLFKNKPLSVGSVVDLNLINSQLKGLIMYIGKNKPSYEYKKMIITLTGREFWPYVGDNIKIGSKIVDDKGKEIAEILDKKVSIAEVRVNTAGGSAVISYDRQKQDIILTLSIIVKKIDDFYYFSETQKVKVNELLFIPFKEIGQLNLPITSIKEIKEVND